jgi:hypothetical protein
MRVMGNHSERAVSWTGRMGDVRPRIKRPPLTSFFTQVEECQGCIAARR